MVKLVDTQASGACGGNPVEVQVLFSAPIVKTHRTIEYSHAQSFDHAQDRLKAREF